VPHSVDLLIGSGTTLSLFAVGQINLSREGYDLYLQKTRLGWVVAGGASVQVPSNFVTSYLTNLKNLLFKFWTVEDVAISKLRSEEETVRSALHENGVSRRRYTVRLPFRNTNKRLGESRTIVFGYRR